MATAVASEYFQAPRKQARFERTVDGDDEEAGGMVTAQGSSETVGPRPALARRRRREQQEEDDSSDLSDESDDDTEPQRYGHFWRSKALAEYAQSCSADSLREDACPEPSRLITYSELHGAKQPRADDHGSFQKIG